MTALVIIPDGYWVTFLITVVLGFAIPEAIAIKNKQGADTLSANIRRWLRTDTPGGGASWLAVWSVLAIIVGWLSGHILRLWP